MVFHVPDKIAELVRKDAAHAGLIPLKSPTTKRVDFHCVRKSCARILIELNIHPKVIQQTLRHSDIRLTMDLYGELGEDDLFRELPGKFPVPRMFATTSQRQRGPRLALLHQALRRDPSCFWRNGLIARCRKWPETINHRHLEAHQQPLLNRHRVGVHASNSRVDAVPTGSRNVQVLDQRARHVAQYD